MLGHMVGKKGIKTIVDSEQFSKTSNEDMIQLSCREGGLNFSKFN